MMAMIGRKAAMIETIAELRACELTRRCPRQLAPDVGLEKLCGKETALEKLHGKLSERMSIKFRKLNRETAEKLGGRSLRRLETILIVIEKLSGSLLTRQEKLITRSLTEIMEGDLKL